MPGPVLSPLQGMIAQQVSVGGTHCLQSPPHVAASTVKEVFPSKCPQRTLLAFLSPPSLLLLKGRGANLRLRVNHLLVGGVMFNRWAGACRLSVLPVISCVGQKAGLTLSQLFHLHLLEGESVRTVGPAVFISGVESRKAGCRPRPEPNTQHS